LNHEDSVLKPLRVGVIGVGRIVERAHLPILAKIPGVTVAGLFDQDPERSRVVAERFQLPATICRTPDELLDMAPDISLVACPNALHSKMSVAALEAGSHVLCEKPIATALADATAMIQASERTGRELMIGFTNRFRPEVKALHAAIQQGRLGEIKSVRCGWLRRKGVPGVGTWFTDLAHAGGGALTDLGSHLLDLVIWSCGRRKILDLSCAVDRGIGEQTQASWYLPDDPGRKSTLDVEVGASAFAVFDGGMDLFIEVSWSCATPYDRTYLQVIGSRGQAQIATLFGFSPDGFRPQNPLKLWVDGEPISPPTVAAVNLLQPYEDQWAYFLESLRQGRSLRPALNDAWATAHVVEAMYEAAREMESVAGIESPARAL
jgi:predicted dehydrogenase